jgi:hypothetical protein
VTIPKLPPPPRSPQNSSGWSVAGQEPFAVGGHHLAGAQVVGGQPVLAHEPADAPAQAELDPDLLVLWISRHVDMDALPDRRVVVDFDLRGPRPGRYWLVLERPAHVSICFEDPCLDERQYVYVQAETAALYQVYMGRLRLRGAVADGALDLSGQPQLVRAFSRWFTWSHFAPIVRAASARRASR